MFTKLCPQLTTKEKATVKAAHIEHQRLAGLGEKYQTPRPNQGGLLPAHPLDAAAHLAFQAACAEPTEEAILAVLAAVNRKAALTESIAEHLAAAIGGHIETQRQSLQPIVDRLVDAARQAFNQEADRRRAALPSPASAGVIAEDQAGALETAINSAKGALEAEIQRFQRDPLESLPALAGD